MTITSFLAQIQIPTSRLFFREEAGLAMVLQWAFVIGLCAEHEEDPVTSHRCTGIKRDSKKKKKRDSVVSQQLLNQGFLQSCRVTGIELSSQVGVQSFSWQSQRLRVGPCIRVFLPGVCHHLLFLNVIFLSLML